MTEYLIAFNWEWVPELTEEQLRARGRAAMSTLTEMKEQGVYVFAGGLEAPEALCSADASSGEPVITDGPYIESKEHLGGFTVVDVPDEQAARYWAGRVAAACGWPQTLHRIRSQPDPEARS